MTQMSPGCGGVVPIHVFVAGPEFSSVPSVVTVKLRSWPVSVEDPTGLVAPPNVTVDDAVRVSVPAVLELAVNVHWPAPSVVPLVHVPPSASGARPPDWT